MSAPTPGPWAYVRNPENTRWIIDGSPHHAIACTAGFEPDNEANARLISAAPDLLDAAIYAVEAYGKPGGPWNVPSDPGGWLDRARAAIAKARGCDGC